MNGGRKVRILKTGRWFIKYNDRCEFLKELKNGKVKGWNYRHRRNCRRAYDKFEKHAVRFLQKNRLVLTSGPPEKLQR